MTSAVLERAGVQVSRSETLQAAMARLADGDRAAFDAVYEVVQPKVSALAVRMMGPGQDAEDAAQTALMKVFANASAYDPSKGPVLPWVMGVATWECRTVRKKLQRRREDPLERELDAMIDAEQALIGAELLAMLESVMGQLSPLDRETLEASLGRQARPDVTPTTFRKRLSRAVGRLRAAWEADHG